MPGEPPRRAPSRGSTRPGAKRDPRGSRAPAIPEPSQVAGGAQADPAQAHAEARSRGGRVLSTLALGVTHRAIALAATFAVLAISFVSSLSVYFGQQRDIAQVKAEILAHQAEIANLQDELNRWQDPAYVKAQARDKLGWVMPGEIGYRVIDADGKLIGGTVSSADAGQAAKAGPWYDTLWASLLAADQPLPDPAAPTEPVIITPDTRPSTPAPDPSETPR